MALKQEGNGTQGEFDPTLNHCNSSSLPPRSSFCRTLLKWKSHCWLHSFISKRVLLQYIFETCIEIYKREGVHCDHTSNACGGTPSAEVAAFNYHLVSWMKTLWQEWESEIKQCYQFHARCFFLQVELNEQEVIIIFLCCGFLRSLLVNNVLCNCV